MAISKEAKKEYDRQRYQAKKDNNPTKETFKWDGYCNLILSLLFAITHFTMNEPFRESNDDNYSDEHIVNFQSMYKYLNINKKVFDTRIKWMTEIGVIEKVCKTFPTKTSKNVQWVIRLNLGLIDTLSKKNVIRLTSYKQLYSTALSYWKSLPTKDEEDEHKHRKRFIECNPWVTQFNDGDTRFLDDKLCGRYFNHLCLSHCPDKHNHQFLDRYEELDDNYNKPYLNTYEEYQDRYVEYDLNASSLRIMSDLINKQYDLEFVSNDIDLYWIVYCSTKKSNKSVIPKRKFKGSEAREVLKVEVQSMIQGFKYVKTKKDSIRHLYNQGITTVEQYESLLKDKDIWTYNDKQTLKLLKRAEDVYRCFGVKYHIFLESLKLALYDVLRVGDEHQYISFGQDYYLIEGCIFGFIKKYLNDNGIEVYIVFDACYGLKNVLTEKDFNDAYKYAINEVYDKLGAKQVKSYFRPHIFGKPQIDELTENTIYVSRFETYDYLVKNVKTMYNKQIYDKFIEYIEPRKSNIDTKFVQTLFTQIETKVPYEQLIPSIQQSIDNNWFGLFPIYNNIGERERQLGIGNVNESWIITTYEDAKRINKEKQKAIENSLTGKQY